MSRRLAVLGLALAALVIGWRGPPATAAETWQVVPVPPAPPKATTTGYVAHDGAQIWYATYGAGPPVVLLHGGLSNSRYWANQVPALVRAGHAVVTIDSRGHGRSTRDARPYTYELMESDVVAVMNRLHIRRAAVVGWSDGAIIGLVMAMKNPERLTRVFAFAANMDPSGVKPDVTTNPVFSVFERRAAGEYAALSRTPRGFDAFSKAINRMWDTEPNYKATDLARIRTPVAIVDGDHDEAIKREHTEYLARSIPGAKLIILRGVSHFAMLRKPALFNMAMLGFLDR